MTFELENYFTQSTVEWFQSAVGTPTLVQQEAWPSIASGCHTLVSAPTGTGKTLSAFLVFIDRLKAMAREDTLEQKLYLIYISPLKSLAGDIRENLNRPLYGIPDGGTGKSVRAAIRTGDTTPSERRSMINKPPHILITTPESLYLLLTSKTGRIMLKTAQAIILDELHAMIDTKRGAHMMLSLARLDRLCGHNLQRIGLSATIEPLETAAAYLSPEKAVIAAPSMEKKVRIEVTGPMPTGGKRKKDPIWEELAKAVYQQCIGSRSVIAFTEARRYAEKIAYFVNQIGGDDFARVHHGSLSKEQRREVEESLRSGKLRLLCATSSMELGIDVGEIDQVLQIGCPRTISGTMQRLGRAGHNPGRVSVMHMYPRTAPESLYCGMTALIARKGGVEHASPPEMCFDVLAQHLVSMAADEGYGLDDVMELLQHTYSFRKVTREDVKDILCMLAGDYEHKREIPVRPRILYDRINERVLGDAYSRMLAVNAGGTIPDKGLYTAKTEDGVILGELDEEFVYETRRGDIFLLGSFAWKIISQDKNTVVVTQAPVDGARLPFWKGETKGRSLRVSMQFGRIMRRLGEAIDDGTLLDELRQLGLDDGAADNAADFLKRQVAATGVLPDDRTILVEHFTDQTGSHQIMVHSMFGRRVNAPLSLLLQHTAREKSGFNLGCVDEEDGFLLYPYGDEILPEGLLQAIDMQQAKSVLEAILPETPLFSINFRYNAARALMMGMKANGRQPLWLQRIRSTDMMDSVLGYENHPLIRETTRECLEENWDISGLMKVLDGIRSGQIAVREMYVDLPSPMSLPLQWQVEAAELYQYTPSTPGIRQAVYDELKYLDQIKPAREELERLSERKKLPEDVNQLHSLLMTEGDLQAGELEISAEWLSRLMDMGRVLYIESGLWIAAEQKEEYEQFLDQDEKGKKTECGEGILRRLLYYRGAQSLEDMVQRYFLEEEMLAGILDRMCEKKDIVEEDGFFYHARLYDRARKATVKQLRKQAVTQPSEAYAEMMAVGTKINAGAEEQLKLTIERYLGRKYPAAQWESILFARRVKNYNESMLDKLLAQGEFYWVLDGEGSLCFQRFEEIDWDTEPDLTEVTLDQEESILTEELKKRGASFISGLNKISGAGDAQATLLRLSQKGLVCADSFVPVRQILNKNKLEKSTVRQRVNVRVMALSAGRWDMVRPCNHKGMEQLLEQLFRQAIIVCRETFREAAPMYSGFDTGEDLSWSKALELLSIWEFTGKIRRGYFIKGMSGAQFVRNDDYQSVIQYQSHKQNQVVWLNACDISQVWGKVLNHMEGRSFLNVPGTAVALLDGLTGAVAERQGKSIRIFEESSKEIILEEFVKAFVGKRLFPGQKRIVVKEYPAGMEEYFKKNGFLGEMQDYVLYQ